jgi:DNA-binding NarL/FixJ family response regulator
MSPPRKKKPSRSDLQQTNQYSYTLGKPLRLVIKTNQAAQNDPLSQTKQGNALTSGRRSTDKDLNNLYRLWHSLSAREKDVTKLVCRGYTNEQIAFATKLSVSTVKSYLQHVFLKIDVRDRTELRLKFFNFDFD